MLFSKVFKMKDECSPSKGARSRWFEVKKGPWTPNIMLLAPFKVAIMQGAVTNLCRCVVGLEVGGYKVGFDNVETVQEAVAKLYRCEMRSKDQGRRWLWSEQGRQK